MNHIHTTSNPVPANAGVQPTQIGQPFTVGRNLNPRPDPVSGHRPEWIRPRDARPIFGLGRAKLYDLAARGHIDTVSFRERGTKQGTRLFSADSIANYLARLAAEQATTRKQPDQD